MTDESNVIDFNLIKHNYAVGVDIVRQGIEFQDFRQDFPIAFSIPECVRDYREELQRLGGKGYEPPGCDHPSRR